MLQLFVVMSKYYIRSNGFFVLVLVLFFSLLLPMQAMALTLTGTGQNQISALVSGPPPSSAPTIDSPSSGTNFDVKNITVSGGCTTGLIVKLFSNNIFVGSVVCQSGQYSLQLDLFIDRNDLIARQYDSLNQPSPDSNTVSVYFLPPNSVETSPSSSANPASIQSNFLLFINYDYTVIGVFPNQPFRLPMVFGGGNPPYAIVVDWGDGTNSIFSKQDNSKFFADHIYKTPGLYTVKATVTDKYGDTAYIQFVIEVKGARNSIITNIFDEIYPQSTWPILFVSLIAAGCFWGGMYFQKRKLIEPKTKPKK